MTENNFRKNSRQAAFTSKRTTGVWVLGKQYDSTETPECRRHAESLFRFTYRKDFAPMLPYSIRSDTGWGCMLRAGQMMMGYTLRRHYLGADWRLPQSNKERSLRMSQEYRHCLNNFTDLTGYPHCYSIHHIVQSGMKYDKLPGEWYGPSTVALTLRDLAHLHRMKYSGPFAVMVTQGDTMYVTEAEKLCCDHALNDSPAAWLLQGLGTETIGITSSVPVDIAIEHKSSCLSVPSTISNSSIEDPIEKMVNTKSPVASAIRNELNTSETGATECCTVGKSLPALQKPSTTVIRRGADKVAPLTRSTSASTPRTPFAANSGASLRASGNTLIKQAQAAAAAEIQKKRQKEKEAAAEIAAAEKASSPFFDPLLRVPPSALSPWTHPLMVIMPLMLGVDSVNTEYIEELLLFFQNKNCVGMLGGKPNYARFFAGYNDKNQCGTSFATSVLENSFDFFHSVSANVDLEKRNSSRGAASSEGVHKEGSTAPKHATHITYDTPSYARNVELLGLDPHTTFSTPTVDVLDVSEFPTAEYISQIHVNDFDTLPLSQLDPSVAIGFFFENREDFEEFSQHVRERNIRNREANKAILFDVQHAPPSCASMMMDTSIDEMDGDGDADGFAKIGSVGGKDEDDEYVFL